MSLNLKNNKSNPFDIFQEEFKKLNDEMDKNYSNVESIQYILKFILMKEISLLNFKVNEESLIKNLLFIHSEYPSNLKGVSLKIMNLMEKINLKIDFAILNKICPLEENEENLKKITKKFLIAHNIMIDDPKDFNYEISINFILPTTEIKYMYDKNFEPFSCHPELKTKIKDIIVKSLITSNLNKNTHREEEFKTLEEELRKYLKGRKTESLNNSINNSKNANLSTSIRSGSDSFLNPDISIIMNEVSFFEEFRKIHNANEDNFDIFENIIIKIISEKFTFSEYGDYINLYLYDNLKKLKDQKTVDVLKNKFRESKEINFDNFEKIKNEMINYYELRNLALKSIFRSPLGAIHTFKDQKNQPNQKNQNEISYAHSSNSDSNDPLLNNENFSSLISTFCDTHKSLNQDDEAAREKFNLDFLLLIFITSKIKNMSEFDLSQNQILNDNALLCLSALKVNESVTKLMFTMNKLGDEGCWGLGRLFNYNQLIVDLDVSINMITDEDLNCLLLGLGKANTSLVRVNLSNNYNMTKKSGPLVAELIKKSPYLKHLNINKNPIEAGFNYISNTLLKLFSEDKCRLEELLALQIKLDSGCLDILGRIILHPKCSLKSLVLSENKFNNEGGRSLIKAIGDNRSIEELILYKCEIGNDLGDELLYMFKNNSKLASVNLYDNNLTDPELFLELISFCQSNRDMDILNSNSLFESELERETNDFILESKDDNELQELSSNNLKNLDLSKNRCKFNIDDVFLNVMENVCIEMLDICQNFDDNKNPDQKTEEFNNIIFKKQKTTKIIY